MTSDTMAFDNTSPDFLNAIDWVDVFYNTGMFTGAETGENPDEAGAELTMSTEAIDTCVPNSASRPNRTTCAKENPEFSPVEKFQGCEENDGANTPSTIEVDNSNQKEIEISDDEKARVRSERKRSREKQKRLDVTSQIADLTNVLQRVEAEDNPQGESGVVKPSNRVDLFVRTIALLSHLHKENDKRQSEVSDLQRKLKKAKRDLNEKVKAQQEAVSTLQQSTSMFMPMFGGGMMQMPMMFQPPAGCFSNFLQNKCVPMVYPKTESDTNKQTTFQAQASLVPGFHSNSQKAIEFANNNLPAGNLAHCA